MIYMTTRECACGAEIPPPPSGSSEYECACKARYVHRHGGLYMVRRGGPRPHIVGGEFQSDKYPTCPRGKVPLSVKDPTAQDLLWAYAQRRRAVDAEFADDLEWALKRAGYAQPQHGGAHDALSLLTADRDEWKRRALKTERRSILASQTIDAAAALVREMRAELDYRTGMLSAPKFDATNEVRRELDTWRRWQEKLEAVIGATDSDQGKAASLDGEPPPIPPAGPEPATETPWYASTFPDAPPVITAGLHSVAREWGTIADCKAAAHRVTEWPALRRCAEYWQRRAGELRREVANLPAVDQAAFNAHLRRAEAAEARAEHYSTEAAQRLRERNAAASAAGNGVWVWSDTDPNDLASMGDDMQVTMTAGQLHALLAKSERLALPWTQRADGLWNAMCLCGASVCGIQEDQRHEAERAHAASDAREIVALNARIAREATAREERERQAEAARGTVER